jgi:Flp pilus assembly protein TadD
MLGCAAVAHAEPVARDAPAAGSVIARKTGEEVRFIDVSTWRGVDIHQDLLAGDVLRTNAQGNLAVLFADKTQVRLGRNTTMLVKEVNPGADSLFGLESGSIWARAERGGEGIVVETPAAAAAIRGTDWTMMVDASGRTSLTVLEGQVELSNAFGSVSVRRGEAASARIGQAPTKIVIVDPDDREQMLFYLSLRNGFAAMPASPLSSAGMRGERARIAAVPEAQRTAEQWLTLAEVGLSYDGRSAGRRAADRARSLPLDASQRARLDLVDGMIAASEKRYDAAIPLLSRAAPLLSGSRRQIALYAAYFARTLANPDHVEQPPSGAAVSPYGALAEAWTAGFLKDIPAAVEVIRRAELRFPDDPTLPAARAQMALLLDDRAQVKEAVDRALALDPDDPTALEARGNYRADIDSDLDGALADLKRATELAPGSSSAWNALGLVLDERGATREAEAALQTAVALDPQDPVSRANLALIYLGQDRLAKAKAEIDRAMAEDPGFDIGLVARGLYHLKTGEMDKAMQDLLAGSTANPAFAQALLLLAAGYYETGQRAPAEQALENADRLDPNDPATANVATAIAADDYDSDRAIRSAQEAMKRTRARGGDYAALGASRDQGSTLNHAYRLQGLDAWGRYYGDVVFDPFSASALADQAIAGSPNPFTTSGDYDGQTVGEPIAGDSALSSLIQGLLLEPQMLAGRSRGANLINRPFIEGAIQGGALSGDASGWTGEAEVKGYLAYPFPISFYGEFTKRDTEESRGEIQPDASRTSTEYDLFDKTVGGFGYLTLSPTPNDNIVLFAAVQDTEDDLRNGLTVYVPPLGIPVPPNTSGVNSLDLLGSTNDRTVDDRTGGYGAAWSHTFGYRNVVSAGVFASGFKRHSLEATNFLILLNDQYLVSGLGAQEVKADSDSVLGSVNHTLGVDDLTLRYGAEGGMLNQNRTASNLTYIPGVSRDLTTTESNFDLTTGRIYADVLYDITPSLKAEAGLFGTMFEGEALDEFRAEPRVGAAWAPFEGHWLRVGYIEESSALNAFTLAPVGVIGMQANQAPLDIGGKSSSFAARWEAQWSDHLFTAVDYQHQELDDLAIPVPLSLDQISLTEGRIDRIGATANLWLTHGFGAFATFAYANSENRDPSSLSYGGLIPYVPEQTARLGLTWVSTADVKVTVAASYVGERSGGDSGIMLDPYWTADAFLTWEPLDKRFELELAAYNLFDEEFEVAPNVPGWGRVFTGSLKVRF